MPIAIARTVPELRVTTRAWRSAGESVALVPTMGALHHGHLALVREGRRLARRVVVSIFVNPTQFAPGEDLDAYPRPFETDCALLEGVHADLVWAPTVGVMYPEGASTSVLPAGPANGLESITRPHFFAGVSTVCCKLFNQVGPDVALFGEKDFQQLAVVRQMVRDLDMPLAIQGVATVREADGLAMSSRNRYLSPAERRLAPRLFAEITAAGRRIRAGERIDLACLEAGEALLRAGFASIDYIEARDAATLAPLEAVSPAVERPFRVLAAVRLGSTRLIDNVSG
jgi:pantoate--beta-alanine ligase